jgi:ligand-binding sensor domain-containing protein
MKYSFIFYFLFSITAIAQEQAIGLWQSHLSYNLALGVSTNGADIFAATEIAPYAYHTKDGSFETFSKVNGLHDVQTTHTAYDATTDCFVFAYANGNLDFYKDDYFFSIPDIKLKTITGSKTINRLYANNGWLYVATDFGLVLIDIKNREVKNTYNLIASSQTLSIKDVCVHQSNIYVCTNAGIYKANKNNPFLQSMNNWTLISPATSSNCITSNGQEIFWSKKDSLFQIIQDTSSFKFKVDKPITYLASTINKLVLCTFSDSLGQGNFITYTTTLQKLDAIRMGKPVQTVSMLNGAWMIADAYEGLKYLTTSGAILSLRFDCPTTFTAFSILADNTKLIVAHGGYDDKFGPMNSPAGISFRNEPFKWKNYTAWSYPFFSDTVRDFLCLAKDPIDATLYAGTYYNGMWSFKSDGTATSFKQNSFLSESTTEPGHFNVTGLAFDSYGNLWMNQFGSTKELICKKRNNTVYKFQIPNTTRPIPYAAAGLLIDDYNQKWYYAPRGGGVIVYNDNTTIENAFDDTYVQLLTGKGAGNLPSNQVNCLVKENTGSIWIGTDNGIGIVNCPRNVITRTCEAEIRIVQYDQFASYLFAGENITAIAVDGANRKWVGSNNGIWLISEDATKIIQRFTVDNSPLPSNNINTISIDSKTGDVYFGTEFGLVSFKSTATEGGDTYKEVLVYPNPISSASFSGTIAIKGLLENADVRFTDINGQLVYKAKALGGQAIWNGVDYTGHKPAPGVYLIFASDKLGQEVMVSKLIINP